MKINLIKIKKPISFLPVTFINDDDKRKRRLVTKKKHSTEEFTVYLIVNNDDLEECLKSFYKNRQGIASHYFSSDFIYNMDRNSFKFVYISTSQRCGTWWHKYFFKFYADSVARYQLHIGIRLRNPLTCQALKTVFFVGHMPFPFEKMKLKGESNNNFYLNNCNRVFEINPGYFNNHSTSLELIDLIREEFDGYKFNRFYYIYRNVFDQFISLFLMRNRGKRNPQNLSLFEYTKRFFLEPFAFQFLSYQWVQERSPGLVKIHRFDDIIKDQKKYFRQLLMDFNVPIHEEALSIATFLSSKKFLDYYENFTGQSINESVNKDQVKHISTKEEKQGVEFTKSEKEFIKDYLINYGLNRKFFPEFN